MKSNAASIKNALTEEIRLLKEKNRKLDAKARVLHEECHNLRSRMQQAEKEFDAAWEENGMLFDATAISILDAKSLTAIEIKAPDVQAILTERVLLMEKLEDGYIRLTVEPRTETEYPVSEG